jgi:hypothetical protein
MSALPPKADIRQRIEHVCFVPIADIRDSRAKLPCAIQKSGIDKPSIQIGRNHYRIGNGVGID